MRQKWVARTAIVLLSLLISFVIVEVAAYAIISRRNISVQLPTYTPKLPVFWFSDINADFGVWHIPNTGFRYKKTCFDIEYQFNSVGARDVERPKVSDQPRVIVLGDSFVEGFGVDQDRIFTAQLEQMSAIPHLNFSTSGHFGPTQYYLLYDTLAKTFDHEAVIVAIFPYNDFHEDDLEYGKAAYWNRYRPYWVGTYPDYELTYYLPEIEESDYALRKILNPQGAATLTQFYLSRYSATFNLFLVFNQPPNPMGARLAGYSGYYDFSQADLDRLQYSLEKLVESADGRPVYVVTIPTREDFGYLETRGAPPLPGRLAQLSAQLGFEYLDLLEPMRASTINTNSLYLVCDGHWNDQGHRLVTEILLDNLTWYKAADADLP